MTSTSLGIAYGGAAAVLYPEQVPISTAILAGGLCSVSGMLPDIDSDSSVPLRESLAFGAAVVTMMAAHRFEQLGMSPESIVLSGALVYLFIRFVFGEWLRRYTSHRGMFHSVPAALIAGELAFLLSAGEDVRIRWYKAGAVVLGYLSHLALDELYSVEWYRGRLRFKKSLGTALKLFGKNTWPNVSVYAKLIILALLVLKEPSWMQQFYQQKLQRPVEHTASQVSDHLLR